jgi:hypothetical protein
MLSFFAQGQVLGPNPIVGGVPVSCGGAIAVVAPINDIAQAAPGQILLNPMLFNLPPVVQVFVYAHECGHQVVGSNETAADCWAIKVGRNQGWLSRPAVGMIQQYFGDSPGDWTHEPGPYRIARMVQCFDAP